MKCHELSKQLKAACKKKAEKPDLVGESELTIFEVPSIEELTFLIEEVSLENRKTAVIDHKVVAQKKIIEVKQGRTEIVTVKEKGSNCTIIK